MLLSLNYALFLLALYLGFDLKRRGPLYKSASLHMFCFATAALLGGFCHQLDRSFGEMSAFITETNTHLHSQLKIGTSMDLRVRLWFLTLLSIGATEYYFMHIFLHPVAVATRKMWLIRTIQTLFAIFCLACVFTYDYPLVVVFHTVSHLIVIGFSIYLIFRLNLKVFGWLIGLCIYNLGAGILWSLQGLRLLSSGPLHHNDWYHVAMMGFVLLLHAVLTRTELVSPLHKSRLSD